MSCARSALESSIDSFWQTRQRNWLLIARARTSRAGSARRSDGLTAWAAKAWSSRTAARTQRLMADQTAAYHTGAVDDVGFWQAIDAEIQPDVAIVINSDPAVRVTEGRQQAAR